MAKACFCLSLPTFGYIIGILNLVLTFIAFILVLAGKYPGMETMNAEEKNVSIIIMTIACALSCIINGLFLYGINKKRAGFVLAYLIIVVLAVAKNLIGAVQLLVLGLFPEFLMQLIVCFLAIYIAYAIYMLYNEIKESSKARPYHAPV